MWLRGITILLLVGCSVEPTAKIRAVADAGVVLGVVFDGSNYSLMLCKTLPTYTEKMFVDQNVCRPALLSDGGKAVVFSPEQLEMTWSERLAGYSKGVAMIASVPLVVVGGRSLLRKMMTKDFAEIDSLLKSGKKLTDESEKMIDLNSGSELVEKTQDNYLQLGKARALNVEMKKRLNVDELATTFKDNNEKLLAKSEQLLVALRKKIDDRVKTLTTENDKRIEKVSNDLTVSLIRTGDSVPEELQKFPVGSFRRDVEMNYLYDQIDEKSPHLPEIVLNWWHNERKLIFLSELAEGKTFKLEEMRARLQKPITRVYSGDSLEEYLKEFPKDRLIVTELADYPESSLPGFYQKFKSSWKESNWLLFKDGYRHYRELTLERKSIETLELLKENNIDIPAFIVETQQQATQQLVNSKRRLLADEKLWDFGQEGDGVFEFSARDSLNAIISARSEMNLLKNELDYLKKIDKDKFIALWNNDSIENTIPNGMRHVERTAELEEFAMAKQQFDEAKNIYDEAIRAGEELDRELKETEHLLFSDPELKALENHRRQLRDDGTKQSQLATEKLHTTGERHNKDISNNRRWASGAGVLTAFATLIDNTSRYIWGYEQRQLSRYWSRIFSQEISDFYQVKDVTKILETLAKTRNHTVNPEALALAR